MTVPLGDYVLSVTHADFSSVAQAVAVSSGSTGNALLLNPTAPSGNGRLINGGFENGARVAFPDSLNAALLGRFGAVRGGEDGDQALLWIERVLLEHPDIADCGVTGVADGEAGEVPKAFVVPREGQTIDLNALAEFIAARVAGYKQIRQFELIDRIPRTPSGKILRRLLKP